MGVKNKRPNEINPYAAADGTPAAETRDVKATEEGRIVHVIIEETTHTTMTALRGCPSTTRDVQLENGSTPSRATAKTRRDAARIAIAVFFVMSDKFPTNQRNCHHQGYSQTKEQ